MSMPRPPTPFDGANDAHDAAAQALQQWLWACAARGWRLTDADKSNLHWHHEDNMEAAQLGWMLARPPGSTLYDVFDLQHRRSPYTIAKLIAEMAPVSPLCAKALTILTAQCLNNPEKKFRYAE